MDYNSGVSLILPDSIGLIENDFDEEDIVHEQTNQNEIVELIMAAFEGHDEPSDDDDDDQSLNTTDSSEHSSDETQTVNQNNNNNSPDEPYSPESNELHHQQTFFPPSKISNTPPLISRTDPHTVSSNDDQSNPFINKTHMVHYQNPSPNSSPPVPSFPYLPSIDIADPMQAQYLNETHNQLNKLRILCSVKDRKIAQLQSLCEEFREKYENDTRALKHQIELSERLKYDFEQRYQLLNTKYEDLIENNQKSHRIIKDSELKIQQLDSNKTQLEKKYSDSECLIESLHRKVNDLQQYESIARSQRDYEQILSTTREKYEQEIFSFNEKLQNLQLNLQEKTNEIDEIHVQLDIANKNTEKTIFERMESINQLNEQLHDCQRKYADLLSTTSFETVRQNELQQEITYLTTEKDKLQNKCQEFEAEIRTLRQRLEENDDHTEIIPNLAQPIHLEHSLLDQSIINENFRLKERVNDYLFKIKQLKDINQTLTEQIQSKNRESSSSSSSASSSETVIVTSVHMDQIRKLTHQIENLRKENVDLIEKFDYERQEFYTIIEQLREEVHELDKTKQLYIDVCQEKNFIEDTLRKKYEFELQMKIDDVETIKQKSREEFQHELNKLKIKHDKQMTELNHELDRLRTNDDTQSRLIYTEKEFEQLKHDYSNLNVKHSELMKTCTRVENENESLLERMKNYENVIKQYEEYRIKLENNLQKITQQRDTNKMDLRLVKEKLTTKENENHQFEKHFQNHQEQFRHYEDTINDLQKQLDQTRDTNKLHLLEEEKRQLEQRLNEANRALDLADSHLQQEIVKIKHSLEQEYKRRYEREQQHRQSTNSLHSNATQEMEEMKKMYRTELDRLYRDNVELSQHQTKLIDAHQKQMQLMKKELDEGYSNVLNEYQREQLRLQTRYSDAQQLIEQLKMNITQMKSNHADEMSKIQGESHQKKHSVEFDYRTRQEHLQQRLEKLVKLLEQSNDALNQERTLRTRQEHDYEQMIRSLQKKLTESTQRHHRTIEELKHDLQQERLINQKYNGIRPTSVPDFASSGLSTKEHKSDYLTTVEKLRELFTKEMIALLRLTCQMIFDVHHRVTVTPCIASLDMNMRKQIDNELIRSRNSMIKEIRREIREKMTFAMKSQGVPDISIDMHIFEIDRHLSQMIHDCLNSLPTIPSPRPPSNSASVSLQITPKRPTMSQLSSPRKSIECIYMTPSINKKPAPIAPHCRSTLDVSRRPKSASNAFLPGQHSLSQSRTHRYQRAIHPNPSMRMHRSEDDLPVAVERDYKQSLNPDDTLAVCEELTESEQSHEPVSITPVNPTPNKSPTAITTDLHYATTRIINHKIEDDDDEEELTWPQEPISTVSSTHSSGIKKFVRNSLKLFITQPQHKRTGK